jgi:hypothetical protein
MSAAIYPTEPIYAGDTWPGIPSITIRPNGEIPADPLDSAKLIFFKAEDGPGSPAFTLEYPEGVSISDPLHWELFILPMPLPLPPGEWTFRFSTTAGDTDNTIRTWLVGVLTIL